MYWSLFGIGVRFAAFREINKEYGCLESQNSPNPNELMLSGEMGKIKIKFKFWIISNLTINLTFE